MLGDAALALAPLAALLPCGGGGGRDRRPIEELAAEAFDLADDAAGMARRAELARAELLERMEAEGRATVHVPGYGVVALERIAALRFVPIRLVRIEEGAERR